MPCSDVHLVEHVLDRVPRNCKPPNPAEAAEGTVRKEFALSIGENSVHGSDSEENAKIEIAQFFTEDQIVG